MINTHEQERAFSKNQGIDNQIDFIRANFGASKADYVRHKNIGGRSNEKGNSYEIFFAISRIATLVPQVFENNLEVYVSSQIPCFVDDLIIEIPEKKSRENYQLKSSEKLSWDGGRHPLFKDFEDQHELNKKQGITCSKIILIVSNHDLHQTMLTKKPEILNGFCDVVLFINYENLASFLDADLDFQNAISQLCPDENPSRELLEGVANLILAAWVSSSTKNCISLKELILRTRNIYPTLIRQWGLIPEIRPLTQKILNSIAGFNYTIVRGFLSWNYYELQFGRLPYDCCDQRFIKFQDTIEQKQPTTFDDLEVWLL